VAPNVLEKMAERGSREHQSRKFGYIWLKKPSKKWLKDRIVFSPQGLVTSPTVFELRAMEEEIKAANFILGIQNDFDSDDFVLYTLETLARATGFLRRLVAAAHLDGIFNVGVPKIGPADHGSVDLFWEKSDRTLLMNFPPFESIANFYGKKASGEISGRFDPSQAGLELAHWLAD
jgi:hypothetical protein